MKIPKFASAIAFASALSAVPAVASAVDSGVRATIYAMETDSRDAGYERSMKPGALLTLDGYVSHLGLTLESQRTSLRKQDAMSGHTYRSLAAARIYHANGLFLEAGIDRAGYRSEFAGGKVWKKDATFPEVGIGLSDPNYDFVLRYFFRENQTENKVSGLFFRGSAKLFSYKDVSLRGYMELGETSYLQVACGSSQPVVTPENPERRNGHVFNVGVGFSFRHSK